ncbi:MAG: hypothetical protein KJO69_07545 [Gammaproteobacteria bacterium]|nr:hypothetical protein [Gammaproteobacteria bacterium]
MFLKPKLILQLVLLIVTSTLPSDGLWASETELIKVPVRAYFIFNKDLGKVSVSREQKSLQNTLLNVNKIWQQAGIEFYFQEQGFYQPKDLKRYKRYLERDRELTAINSICPRTKNGLKGIDLCVIGQRESNKGLFVSDFKIKNKINGRYVEPRLGRSDSRAPRVVLPIKYGSRTKAPNAIKISQAFGVALRLKRHESKPKTMYLMGRMPSKVLYGKDYTDIKLKPEEVALARENAAKIAQ